MNTRNLVVLLIFIGYFSGNAQNKKDVLLTINSNPIYSSDFTKVFNKNLDLVLEESQKNVAGYLDLFIDISIYLLIPGANNPSQFHSGRRNLWLR